MTRFTGDAGYIVGRDTGCEVESSSSSLQVEPLTAAHFPWLETKDQGVFLPQLQTLLLRGWLGQVETLLPGLVNRRQPLTLVARQRQTLLALLVMRPHNRQGSCWRMDVRHLNTPTLTSQGQLYRELFKQALLQSQARSCRWVVRCSMNDSTQLSALRELGFQPIRTLCRWAPSDASGAVPSACRMQPSGLSWLALDRRTAPLLWPLDQASTTNLQRQIVDRHPLDLIDQGGAGSGVLLASGTSGEVAIAGLVRQQRSDNVEVLELLREPAWDARLHQSIPWVLATAADQNPHVIFACNSEDTQLKATFHNQGMRRLDDELFLGRSLWRRQSNVRRLEATRPLEAMLGRLQPQQPPLPTPSLGDR